MTVQERFYRQFQAEALSGYWIRHFPLPLLTGNGQTSQSSSTSLDRLVESVVSAKMP